jgi:uncharacterized protein YhaN
MVLTRLEIKRFKCLRELAVDLAPGINVVRGPNESGKSTLRRALLAALFDNPTSASDEVRLQTTWGESEAYELRLGYQDREGRACLLRKDFADQKIFLQIGEESYKTRSAIQERVQDELGVESKEFYALCASLDVRELEKLDAKAAGRVGRQMLAGMLTGTGSGTDILQTVRRLDEALKELRKGLSSPAKAPGPLKEVRERISRLQAEKGGLEQSAQTRQDRERKLAVLEQALEQKQARLLDLDHLLEANRKLIEAGRREAELAAQDERFDAQARHRQAGEQELADLDRRLAADPVSAFTSAEIAELQCLRPEPSTPGQPVAAPAPAESAWVWGVLLAVVGAGLLWVWPWVGLLALSAGTGLAWLGWQRRRKARAARLQACSEAERLAVDRNARLQIALDRAHVSDLETLVAKWSHVQADVAKRRLLERDLRERPTGDETAWKALRSELRLLRDILSSPELLAQRIAPETLAARTRERQDLAAAAEEDRRQRDVVRALLEHDTSFSDRRQEVEEALAAAKDRLFYLEARERVGDLALSFMEQARQQTLNPAREVLETRAGEMLTAFTGGRYTRVSVVEEDLSSRVFVAATGRWEDPQVLSQGARDQFFLSLRLALTDILTGGRRIPLLLDEPFAAFDQERLAAALDWLRGAARERQILLFTCRPEYDTVAERVIRLERAAEPLPEPRPSVRGGNHDA